MFPDALAYEPCGLNQIYSLKYGTVPMSEPPEVWMTRFEPWTRARRPARGSSSPIHWRGAVGRD